MSHVTPSTTIAPREAECNCHRCGEGVYFVEGVVGPDRWRHVRTHQSRCAPICTTCSAPATVQIGHDASAGDGTFGFRRLEWRCAAHSHGQLHIDRV
jgi:hypothetical protein